MARSIATLGPGASFKHRVAMPHAGRDAIVEMVFTTRDRDELQEFVERLKSMTDEQAIADCAQGWDLDDEYTPENIARLCNKVPGAGYEIVQAYLRAHFGTRV